MNYTKGKWIADIRVGMVAVHIDDKEKFNCLDGAQDECIYVRHGYRGKDGWEVSPEDIANAHLIAAAPQLYEALKQLEGWYKNHAGELPMTARLAIEKAEGKEPK